MKIIFLIFFSFLPVLVFSQETFEEKNYIFWSKERKLQTSDFHIKVANVSSSYSFGQFSFDYTIGSSFSFGLPKDYKKKIRNYFIKSASWIDTTYDTSISLKYQQTLFDLAEVYVRQFRKAVYDKRSDLTWGKLKIDAINSEIMTAFSIRRVEYDSATNFGTNTEKQLEWEKIISKELENLTAFSAE